MQILTEYQLAEVTLGILYFFFLYIIASYIFNGRFDGRDIIVTTLLFAFWFFLIKVTTNYFAFVNRN